MTNSLIEYYFKKCRSLETFPFEHCSETYLKTTYNKFKHIDSGDKKMSNTCLKIIYTFHPSLWYANKNGRKSPYEAWFDDELLIKCIKNRIQYKGEKLTPIDIRSGFTISQLAPKVSIFRPYVARYLIKKYLDEFDTIFDPCSGYSGRLLGAVSLDKKYIGQDINYQIVNESRNLINFYSFKNAEVKLKNSLEDKGEYDCLFTCPPYGSKENWNQEIEELSADEWIDICIKNYKCKKYLFVVDKTEKYKEYIVDELINKSNWGTNKEIVIIIDRLI